MGQFEKEYYEASDFWAGDMLTDDVNLQRYETTELLIPEDVRRLADVGCGNGVFVNNLQKNKPSLDIYAIDRSSKALEFVKPNKIQAEITSLPFDDKYFDCVTCLEVLEHLGIDDFKRALSEIARTSNRYIIISVPFAEKVEEAYTKCPACKSIFNKELHLQSFDEKKFIGLFDQFGFKNVSMQKLNSVSTYKWHYEFRKLFYPEQLLQWRSPICPICGYRTESSNLIKVGEPNKIPPRKLISYLGYLPKLFWPKETSYYWIVGLFKIVDK